MLAVSTLPLDSTDNTTSLWKKINESYNIDREYSFSLCAECWFFFFFSFCQCWQNAEFLLGSSVCISVYKICCISPSYCHIWFSTFFISVVPARRLQPCRASFLWLGCLFDQTNMGLDLFGPLLLFLAPKRAWLLNEFMENYVSFFDQRRKRRRNFFSIYNSTQPK